MEKALLSGGFDAIKLHVGNQELNVLASTCIIF